MNKKLRTIKEIIEKAHNQDYAAGIVDFVSFGENFRYYGNEKSLCVFKAEGIVSIPITSKEIVLLNVFLKESKNNFFKETRKKLLTL
jgi:hypothetical protein